MRRRRGGEAAHLIGNGHVADDEIGQPVGVVKAAVARRGDDVGELVRRQREEGDVFEVPVGVLDVDAVILIARCRRGKARESRRTCMNS